MENDATSPEELKGSIHFALERAIETTDPDERREAIGAAINEFEELFVLRSTQLTRRILQMHGLI
jgi:hypothetical protein